MKQKLSILFLIALVLNSCKKEEFEINNLNNNKIVCLGHGGMGVKSLYPMNSMESLINSLETNADGTEFDVQMTKDSVLVLFRDEDLSKQTNMSGMVNSYNWNELKDAYYNENPLIKYNLISVEEFFNSIENLHQYTFTFDCKLYAENSSADFFQTYINAIISLANKYEIDKNNICIESQNTLFLKLFKEAKPDWKLFIYDVNFEEALQNAMELKLYGITISTEHISKEQIAIAHAQNLKVTLWNTLTNEDNEEAIMKNPDYIQSDRIENLLNQLNR